MKLEVLDRKANVVGEEEIPIEKPRVKNKGVLLNRVVRVILMNRRAGTASTKTRSDVSGGGKKPWRQKGTGRARVGSIRSPLWRGGGVVFGPHPREFSLKINRKEKKKAFLVAFYDRVEKDGIVLIDDLSFDRPSTKEARRILDKLGISGKVLIVLDSGMDSTALSFRNIDGVESRNVSTLNTYDMLRFKSILVVRSAFEKLKGRLTDG